MIKSFKHNGLQKFFESGITKGIKVNHAKKLSRMLALIDEIEDIEEIKPFSNCHQLKGNRSTIWSLSVSENWRLTFEFKNGNVCILNYEDYH